MGFGTVLIIVPALAALIGIREAIPLLSVVAIFANLSRAVFSWRSINWMIVRNYGVVAAICALPSAWLFPRINGGAMELFLGILTVVVVPLRHLAERRNIQMRDQHIPYFGAGVGLLTGTGATIGPLVVPCFINYGLTGTALLGSDGASTVLVQVAKVSVFASLGLLKPSHLPLGLMLIAILVIGAAIGKQIAERVSRERFASFVDIAVVGSGIVLLVQGFHSLTG